MPITIVNMIPQSLSGERNQDSEPNVAVDASDPRHAVATAFTPDPMGGAFAPIYVSSDGGANWALRTVVPGNGSFGTGDITVGFSTRGSRLYAGILNGPTGNLQILRTHDYLSTAPMDVLVDRPREDQPWVVATRSSRGTGPIATESTSGRTTSPFPAAGRPRSTSRSTPRTPRRLLDSERTLSSGAEPRVRTALRCASPLTRTARSIRRSSAG